MKREELLRSKEYWIGHIQNELFQVIKTYMEKKGLTRTQLAEELNVTKGYITQVLNGDFDHKISKLVELAVACNAAPLLYFTDLDKYIKDDAADKTYNLLVPSEKSPKVRKSVKRSIKSKKPPAK